MDAFFMPKAFDDGSGPDYCAVRQCGETATEPHWHSGAEIIYMDKGVSSVFFNGEWTKLTEKSMLFVPPRQPHCCRCGDKTAIKYVLGFTKNYIGRENCGIALPSGAEKLCIIENLSCTDIPRLIRDLTNAADKNDASSRLTVKAEILLICAYIAKHWEKHGIQTNSGNRDIAVFAAEKYIAEHFSEDVSPYEFARHAGISYSHLAKLLKQNGTDSFTAMLKRTRIDEAKRLLSTTNDSITDIGYACGFGDTSYFIKTFKSTLGITPKEYRKLCKEIPE